MPNPRILIHLVLSITLQSSKFIVVVFTESIIHIIFFYKILLPENQFYILFLQA